MITGVTKWFDSKKGFGFVESSGSDYFVHYKEIKGQGFATLEPGDRVEFEASKSPKGLVAKNLKKIVSDFNCL